MSSPERHTELEGPVATRKAWRAGTQCSTVKKRTKKWIAFLVATQQLQQLAFVQLQFTSAPGRNGALKRLGEERKGKTIDQEIPTKFKCDHCRNHIAVPTAHIVQGLLEDHGHKYEVDVGSNCCPLSCQLSLTCCSCIFCHI
jgi:hypothetical protein